MELRNLYILAGVRTDDGIPVVWTGKSGDGWVSTNLGDALPETLANLQRKIDQFNPRASLTGVFWTDIIDAQFYVPPDVYKRREAVKAAIKRSGDGVAA